MIDLNETSHENLEDITKALKDMDSLDMELFSDSFKKPKSTSVLRNTNLQLDAETKKKVLFKGDSNDDDLLFGLLSDEESSVKEKKNVFASSSKSSLMEDFFKMKSPITSTTSIRSSNELDSKFNFEHGEANQLFSQKPNSYLGSNSNFAISQTELPKERTVQRLQKASRNESNFLPNSSNMSCVVENQKTSLLKENLFDSTLDSSIAMNSVILKNVEKVESGNSIQYTNSAQDSKTNASDQSTKHFTAELRKGRRNAKVINDPLGLLSAELLSAQSVEWLKNDNVTTKKPIMQDTKEVKVLPEWLGGSKKLEDKQIEVQQEGIPTIDKPSIGLDSKTTAGDIEAAPILPHHVSLLFGAQLNQQNALINMQQQEHELRTATILSQQSDQLSKVSAAQHAILHNQEEQFNTLFKLHFERQDLLQKQIQMQQERINQYINTLIMLSTSNNKICHNECEPKSVEEEKDSGKVKEEMETKIKALQEEITTLESKLCSISKKHDNELAFQAELYERQMSFLKEALVRSEERVKHEIECLDVHYVTKLEKLKDEKTQLESQYKEEIHKLKTEHSQYIEEICKLHSDNVQLLQKEYANVIESISRAKQIEDQIMETMTSRKINIEDILHKVDLIIENIDKNQKNFELKHNEIVRFQDNIWKVYETDIKAQRVELRQQNCALEEHRNTFIQTAENVDVRLTELITELQKQSTLCNQAQESLEKRAAILSRERELFEERMKWERDYMQLLKESWIKEQDKHLKLLAEEKDEVATEKAQLVVLSRLKSNCGEIAKVELEATIKSAQEAIASATREKLKWQEKLTVLNSYKQNLQDKENLLLLRAKELENLTRSALVKKEEAKKALKNAKRLEFQNKERFNQLQIQIQALMERERSVATERYNVTKSRMLSLACESGKQEEDINVLHDFQSELLPFSNMHTKSQVNSEIMNIVDPSVIMLKLDFNDAFESTNKYM